jgi:hypothetical protein
MYFTVPTVPVHEKPNKVATFSGTVRGIHRASTVPGACHKVVSTESVAQPLDLLPAIVLLTAGSLAIACRRVV